MALRGWRVEGVGAVAGGGGGEIAGMESSVVGTLSGMLKA